MTVVLIILSSITLANCLAPAQIVELADDNAREVISKYISNIPDIKDQFIIDERLSKAISHYFKGRLSSFPLYRISLKIDRNPVKIPWNIEATKEAAKAQLRDRVNNQMYHPSPEPNKHVQKKYKYEKHFTIKNKDIDTTNPSEKHTSIQDKNIETTEVSVELNTSSNKETKISKKPDEINQHKELPKKKLNVSTKTKRIPKIAAKLVTTESTTIDNLSTTSAEINDSTNISKNLKISDDSESTTVPSILATESESKAETTINNITEESSQVTQLSTDSKSENWDTTSPQVQSTLNDERDIQ